MFSVVSNLIGAQVADAVCAPGLYQLSGEYAFYSSSVFWVSSPPYLHGNAKYWACIFLSFNALEIPQEYSGGCSSVGSGCLVFSASRITINSILRSCEDSRRFFKPLSSTFFSGNWTILYYVTTLTSTWKVGIGCKRGCIIPWERITAGMHFIWM